jgi:Tfp pilus assembly protein PilN
MYARSGNRPVPEPDMSALETWPPQAGAAWTWIRDAWAWWTEELAALIPPALRRRLEGRPELTAEIGVGGLQTLRRRGRAADLSSQAGSRRRKAALLLTSDQVLLREIALPALADRDLRRLVTLDIDRLTPFRAEEVYLATALLGPGETPQSRRYAVAVVRRAAAERAVAAAEAAGLEAVALGVLGEPPDLDFLPWTVERQAAGRAGRASAWAWALAALLLAANLAAAVVRDVKATRDLRETVSADRPRLQQVLRARKTVQDEEARRADLLSERAMSEPLHSLDAATRALPDGAWVQRLYWTPHALRLAGFRQADVDVAEALKRAAPFKTIRNSTPDAPQTEAGGQPFDVTAEIDAEHRP